MATHSPQRFAADLGAKLATRSRHVGVLLGAGASKACGLPDVSALQVRVTAALKGDQKAAFTRLLTGRNVEQVLSRIRRIGSLLTGTDTVDGLTKAQAEGLDKSVCQCIVRALDIDFNKITPVKHLASWMKRANYRHPIELFTVNYDLLLETALEDQGVPYFDGFVGNLRARFRAELVEAPPDSPDGVPSLFVRLWKLHGSVNWQRAEKEIVRIGQPVPDGLPAAIYPSDEKYEESRRVPFLVLQDRLRRSLLHPESLVLISGFSFGDEHLNEMLFDAAGRRERSEFVIFSFDALSPKLIERAQSTPNIQLVGQTEAVLGGVLATWEPPSDDIPDIWKAGKMALPDFTHLAAYLARSSALLDEARDDA